MISLLYEEPALLRSLVAVKPSGASSPLHHWTPAELAELQEDVEPTVLEKPSEKIYTTTYARLVSILTKKRGDEPRCVTCSFSMRSHGDVSFG